MEALEKLLHEHDIAFDAVDRQVMCFAHIINLCSGHVINAINDNDESTSDPIGLACGAVRSIQASGLCRDAFNEVVQNGNTKGWFKTGEPPRTIQLKQLQLLQDMCVQWNSTYFVINRLGVMRPV